MVVIEGFQETGPHDSDRHFPVILGLLLAASTLVGIGILTEPEPADSSIGNRLPRILETWVETYNSEKIDDLLALYSDDAVINGTLLQLDQDYIRAVHSLNMSWDETLSLSDCREVVGVLRCDYVRSNDMLQRAGVTGSGLIEFGFDITGSIRRSDLIVVNRELIEFEGALSAWIEAEHPEVELATRFGQVRLEADPGDILVLVDEFVEQSEVYPLPD